MHENTPSIDLWSLDFKRSGACSRLLSGSTAAPGHTSTCETLGWGVWCLCYVCERRLSSRVADAVFVASCQLPPVRSAFGPLTLTEKLKLTDMCKGIWPRGLSVLFFPPNINGETRRDKMLFSFFSSFEELHKLSRAEFFFYGLGRGSYITWPNQAQS